MAMASPIVANPSVGYAVSPAETSGTAKIPVAVIEHCSAPDQTSAIEVRLGVINEVLRKQRVPVIRPDDVWTDLESQSAWRGTVPGRAEEDWLIDADWWQKQTAAVRKKLRPYSSPNSRTVPLDEPPEREFPAQDVDPGTTKLDFDGPLEGEFPAPPPSTLIESTP